MDYQEWEQSVPSAITGDALWRVQAYRLALFVAEIGWRDVTILAQDRRMVALSDQLYRALGSISANIAEGYSRGIGRDRALREGDPLYQVDPENGHSDVGGN